MGIRGHTVSLFKPKPEERKYHRAKIKGPTNRFDPVRHSIELNFIPKKKLRQLLSTLEVEYVALLDPETRKIVAKASVGESVVPQLRLG